VMKASQQRYRDDLSSLAASTKRVIETHKAPVVRAIDAGASR
jgi:hypothetical protein